MVYYSNQILLFKSHYSNQNLGKALDSVPPSTLKSSQQLHQVPPCLREHLMAASVCLQSFMCWKFGPSVVIWEMVGLLRSEWGPVGVC